MSVAVEATMTIVALGSAEPFITQRLATLNDHIPMLDLRLKIAWRREVQRDELATTPKRINMTIPPRSLGRLRQPLKLLVRQRILDAIGVCPDLFIVFYPTHAPVLKAFPKAYVAYLPVDDYSHYTGWPSVVMAQYEKDILTRSDVICPVSSSLKEQLARRVSFPGCRILVSPNALPSAWIPASAPAYPLPLPAAFGKLERPVAGLIGRLGDRIRWSWIEYVVRQLPGLSWLFIGSVEDMTPENTAILKSLRRLTRCAFIGHQPYQHLPHFMASLDIAVLAYDDLGINPSASPVRFFSHLPFYASIVATSGCRQLEEFPDIIDICRTPQEFADVLKCRAERGERGSRREARWREAHQHTWEARASSVAEFMNKRRILSRNASRV